MTRFSHIIPSAAISGSFAPAFPAHASADTAAAGKADLGRLPEWNLADLYPSPDGPELSRDIEKAMQDSRTFEERWKGKLGEEAAKPQGGRFAEAIKEF